MFLSDLIALAMKERINSELTGRVFRCVSNAWISTLLSTLDLHTNSNGNAHGTALPLKLQTRDRKTTRRLKRFYCLLIVNTENDLNTHRFEMNKNTFMDNESSNNYASTPK